MRRIVSFALLALIGAAAAPAFAQTDLARWGFTTVVAPTYNTPAATGGVNQAMAFLTQLGMDNTYQNANPVAASAAYCDVVATPTNPNPLSTSFTWRVRGTQPSGTVPVGNNGWANAAPQFTQGAQANVSTLGYRNIIVSFDWFSTTQGIRDLQVQYNTNVNNAAGWTNFTGTFAGNVATELGATGNRLLIATSNNYNTVGTSVTTNTIDFAANGITNVANNATFGIRLVSAYDPAQGIYGSAAAAGTPYNNMSGNWRFDQIAVRGTLITGTAVAPEPAAALLLLPGLGLIAARLRRRVRQA